jgi:hypothetical protein
MMVYTSTPLNRSQALTIPANPSQLLANPAKHGQGGQRRYTFLATARARHLVASWPRVMRGARAVPPVARDLSVRNTECVLLEA